MAAVMATNWHGRLLARLGLRLRVAARTRRWSLRSKGWAALLLLALFEGALWLRWNVERDHLQDIVQQLDQNHQRLEILTEVNVAVAHSAVGLHQALNNDNIVSQLDPIVLDLHSFLARLPQLGEMYPELAPALRQLQNRAMGLNSNSIRETALALRDAEFELVAGLDERANVSQQQGRRLLQEYSDRQSRVTTFFTTANLLGLAVCAAAITLFFTRMASDLRKLEQQAAAVVGGYRGTIRGLERNDELGALMKAIQRMQLQLRQREQEQEVSRQQKFHQEKMAAVGSIASAVAHEIGNPLNAIAGIAQHALVELTSGERPPDAATLAANARLTLSQAERIGSIVRQMADLTAPRSPGPELFDANELVRSTCSFVRFDRRLRNIELATELDRELPAVHAVPDHITQILMNLLINAADALEGTTGRKHQIRVTTGTRDGRFELAVSDNGEGMAPEVLAQAFEESFTTKPVGKGRGIGLYLCRTLIEEAGGTIELESRVGQGTTATVRVPMGAHAQEQGPA